MSPSATTDHSARVAPGGLPGLGHLPSLAADPLGYLRRLRSYGDLVVIRVGTLPVHVLNAPELVHRMLVTEADGFDKGRLFERAGPVLGQGLLASEGDHHRRQRRLLQPAFHRRCAASWAEVTETETAVMCGKWRPGEVVDVVPWTRTLATRVVLRALFMAEPADRILTRVDRALPVLLRGFVPGSCAPTARLENCPRLAASASSEQRGSCAERSTNSSPPTALLLPRRAAPGAVWAVLLTVVCCRCCAGTDPTALPARRTTRSATKR